MRNGNGTLGKKCDDGASRRRCAFASLPLEMFQSCSGSGEYWNRLIVQTIDLQRMPPTIRSERTLI
jgi:hypothetical protein